MGLDPTIIRSFNWNGGNGRHLANQDYNICIRRESGIGRVCYSQDATAFLNDFLISSGTVGDAGAPANVGLGLHGKASFCGNYGAAGKGPTAGPIMVGVNDNFCGACLAKTHAMPCQAGTPAAVVANSQQSICSRATPFLVRFVTDAGEGPLETVQSGFNLGYETFA